jgi:hypothetical protein
MTYEPIQRVEIENYGCIRKLDLALSPLHALIGPNDSGKSTILRALRTAVDRAARNAPSDLPVVLQRSPPPVDPTYAPNARMVVHYADGLGWATLGHGPEGKWFIEAMGVREPADPPRSRVTPATMVRFDPDTLREPGDLIPESYGVAFRSDRGDGLASVMDAIANRDTDAFVKIQNDARSLFPSVAKVGLINVSASQKEVAVTLVDGNRVGAKAMSEGLLYYLAFLALRYVEGSHLFLVEEPENGLHPARIAEVMGVLREMSKTSQVVIATHSPLVVNELGGEEVSVVTRTMDLGTRAILLKDVPGYADAMKVYRPGEFWVSYCNGEDEGPLLNGTPRQ